MAALARRQHGVVSGRQLRRLGYSESAISRAAELGRLHRLHRDVYAVGHTNLTDQGRHLSAVLACGPGALLSHRSAAWLWGILSSRTPVPWPIEVTGPQPRLPRGSIWLHRSRSLLDEDRRTREGIPLTSVPRTVLDMAPRLGPERLGSIIESSERLELFDLAEFDSLLARSNGHHGWGRLRRALAGYRDDEAFTRSPPERRFLKLIRRSRLPQPSFNVYVAGHEVDVYWSRERFAIELDSFEFHRTRAAFERDRRRQEDLKVAGIDLLRITSRRLDDDPAQLIERLEVLLAERRDGSA
jgi:very-short-patch-repair endonuclease